jgi:hypothetical protein
VTVDATVGVGRATSIAIGADGFPRISYRDNVDGSLRVASCMALDCSGAVTIEAVDGAFSEVSSIAIAPNGNPLVAYHDDTADALMLARCHSPDCAGAETLHTLDDPLDDVGLFASLAVNTDGRAVVAYLDGTSSALWLAACLNAACNNVSTVAIDVEPDRVGYYASLALRDGEIPVIAYQDDTAGTLKLAACADAACAAPASIVTVDGPTGSRVGAFAALALDADGLPVISYFDEVSNSLKVAKCTDAACIDPATITTLDNHAAGAGIYTDIAIRPNGLPIVSYQRGLAAGGAALAVVECRTPDCAGGADQVLIDARTGETTGSDTSIAIGSDGGAVISYFDRATTTLKLAKCSAQGCDGPGDDLFRDGFEE